jgi:hypothetical protein
MDAQDFRSLQEAYMEVVKNQQLDEVSLKTALSAYDERKHREMITPSDRKNTTKSGEEKSDLTFKRVRKKYGQRVAKKMRDENSYNKYESYDLYDIILSHLLDEGYAETPEAAEAIMVSMSEEWREDIVEELTGERKRRALEKAGGREALGKIPMPLAARVAVGREGQPLEIARKDPRNSVRTTTKGPTKRGGSGFKGRSKSDFQGTDDTVGSGNKAARRAGKKVKDTSDEL